MNVELVAALLPIHRQLAISGILYMGAAGLVGVESECARSHSRTVLALNAGFPVQVS